MNLKKKLMVAVNYINALNTTENMKHKCVCVWGGAPSARLPPVIVSAKLYILIRDI